MPRIPALVALTLALLTAGGCQSLQTAPGVYKMANQARFNAVSPWLTDYATLKPALAPRIFDLVNSWDKEVQAQRAASAPTTQP
jgi:hypothetical protein